MRVTVIMVVTFIGLKCDLLVGEVTGGIGGPEIAVDLNGPDAEASATDI